MVVVRIVFFCCVAFMLEAAVSSERSPFFAAAGSLDSTGRSAADGGDGLSFTDITLQAGTAGPTGYLKTGGHSAVWADVNADSLPDLYITMMFADPVEDLFFLNIDGQRFMNAASMRGIADPDGGSHGAVWADLDNDGDFDLINGTTLHHDGGPDHNDVYRNDGTGHFSDATPDVMRSRREYTRCVLAFDMDRDGDLDIFCVTNYLGSEDPPGEGNEVYLNQGQFRFTERRTGDLYSCPAAQGATDTDFDGDGDIDVIIANRTGPTNILRNNGMGEFSLVHPSEVGIFDKAEDGITAGDVDNDGDIDLILSDDNDAELYLNQGEGTFVLGQEFYSTDGYMGGLADLDNDGDLDLVFAGDDVAYLNDGTGGYEEGPPIPVAFIEDPRGIGFADIDSDGDLDFAVGVKRSRNWLVRNDYAGENRWLKVELYSPRGQAGAFGSKVRLYASGDVGGDLLSFREARSNNGYLGQDDPVLHFGLGGREAVDVAVAFLDGSIAVRTGIPADRKIIVDGADVLLEVKVFLEGAMRSGMAEMSDSLSVLGVIPKMSVYAEDPREMLHLPDGIVDWVLLKLKRDGREEACCVRSCLLRTDGRLVMGRYPDSVLPLTLDEGFYYVVIEHRNHLRVMSSEPVFLERNRSTLYDFSESGDRYFDGSGARYTDEGRWVVVAGNADDQDQDLFASDLAAIKDGYAKGLRGYQRTDVNLDGTVSGTDYQIAKNNMLRGLFSTIEE